MKKPKPARKQDGMVHHHDGAMPMMNSEPAISQPPHFASPASASSRTSTFDEIANSTPPKPNSITSEPATDSDRPCTWCTCDAIKAKEPYRKVPSRNTDTRITRAQGLASTCPNSETMRVKAVPSAICTAFA